MGKHRRIICIIALLLLIISYALANTELTVCEDHLCCGDGCLICLSLSVSRFNTKTTGIGFIALFTAVLMAAVIYRLTLNNETVLVTENPISRSDEMNN